MRLPGFATRNLRLKLLATLIAVVTWAGVVYAANPPGTRSLSVPVPQATTDLPAGYLLLQRIPNISVRIAGNQDHLNAFSPSSLTVRIDYTVIKSPGQVQLPVTVTNNDPNVELDHVPAAVAATVDQFGSRDVEVHIVESHQPPPGYVVGTQIASPSTVRITGPQRDFAGLQVRASVDLTNQRASFKGDVQVFPFDSVGNQLSAVNVEPTTVNVLITIGAVSTERTSAVQLVVKGRLPSGYQLSPVVFSPLTVTLSGSQDLINVPDLSRVLTAPVDITGLTGSKSFTVGIITPSGVTASPNSITVTISTTLIPTPPPTPTPRPTPTPTPG